MIHQVDLTPITLPDFGLPGEQPEIRGAEYAARIETACSRAFAEGLDYLVIYGDREHFSNLEYLTGYDPRFEEALLVLPVNREKPTLIVGNEGMDYSELSPVSMSRRLYQGFSLLGQKRNSQPRLGPVLQSCGIGCSSRVGVVGWKYVTGLESDDPVHWLDVPAYIVDMLRSLTGDSRLVTNVTDIFMNPMDGLRTINTPDQLAVFEYGSTLCSTSVLSAIQSLRPGMNELEAARNMNLNGLPLSTHPNLSTGPRARLGLPSPSNRIIRLGDPIFVALGLRGGLTARAGFVAYTKSDLPVTSVDYLERLVKPYYTAVVAWYGCVGLDVSGGDLQAVVDSALAGQNVAIALNPGHLIHTEEWLHSPVYEGSELPMRSGMLVQCDIIPSVEPRYHTANVEDTIALADESLRDQMARTYPEVWHRIQARRAFMQDQLGIRLKPEVLPFSNMPAYLQPYVLSPNLAMTVVH